jgi:hypothetical protein
MTKNFEEKRRGRRRTILESFSLFCVIPKRGLHQLPIHNISESGVAITVDVQGENIEEIKHTRGEILDLRLYLNRSLFIPVSIKIARIEIKNGIRLIGAEFVDTDSLEYRSIQSFLSMLDHLIEIAQIDSKIK